MSLATELHALKASRSPADLLTKLHLVLVRAFLRQPALVEHFGYADDPERSRIAVTDAYTFNRADAEKRPFVVVSRGPWRWQNRTLGQRAPGGQFLAGVEHFEDLVDGATLCYCGSRSGVEAERLAELLWRFFPAVRGFIGDLNRKIHGPILDFQGAELGSEALTLPTSDPELVQVSVTTRYLLNLRWSTSLLTPVIEAIQHCPVIEE